MNASKVKEKLIRLPSARASFNKIYAVLPAAKAASMGVSEQASDPITYEASMERKAHQLEVELMRAQAEQIARQLRQRLL